MALFPVSYIFLFSSNACLKMVGKEMKGSAFAEVLMEKLAF
jgi:hypothetical protein